MFRRKYSGCRAMRRKLFDWEGRNMAKNMVACIFKLRITAGNNL